MFLVLLTIGLCMLAVSNGLNILIWSPTYGQSHVNFMGNIADTLHDAGHNVTMLLVENDRDVRGIGTTRNIKNIRYSSPLIGDDEWASLNFKKSNTFYLSLFELSDYLKMENMNNRICQSMLNDNFFLARLKTSKFDLVFVEMFHFCPAGIAHITQIPKIVLASALGMTMAHYEFTGLPITLSNTPAFLTANSSVMSFPQRVFNLIMYYTQKFLYLRLYYSEKFLFNSRFENFPDLVDLYKTKTDYILLNVNEFTDPIRPLTPNIKYIGGVSTTEPKPLPTDLEHIVDRASKGVVLFSLGSIVKSGELPYHIRMAFTEAFRSFPEYTFLWKDDLIANSTVPNVYYRDWLPQVDLLAHTRVKAFITHGGMNSIHESLLFGVPMVMMPIFGDQEGNAALACERGYAVKLSKFHVIKEDIIDALKKVLGENGEDSSYTLMARQAARILEGSPARMRDEILRIARNSGEETKLKHLAINADRPFFRYYNLDAYIYFVFTVTAGLAVVYCFINVEILNIFSYKNCRFFYVSIVIFSSCIHFFLHCLYQYM